MKERLIELRNYFQMSQREFCEKMSLKQQTYAPFETGRRIIRDTYITLICQTYNVNEKWLRTGEGEMFIEKPDRQLDELLEIYDKLTPALKSFLLNHAKEIRELHENREL